MIAMVMPAESLENPDGNLVRDKDRPLRDDIRLLGRVLGETVRDQDGQAVYDVVERIRRVCIRFRRDADEMRA
jgi:phosphoenolpyruvate carboxylase